MIVPDVNLLVYAYNEGGPNHSAAAHWWTELMNGEQPVGLPWAVVFGFVRLVTHPSVLVEPLRPQAALERVQSWFERDHVRVVDPGPRHLELVSALFAATGVASNLTTDTHLAAIAIEHQAELHSNDSDFTRFPGLRHRNPLR
jgi:uncharacterized protein